MSAKKVTICGKDIATLQIIFLHAPLAIGKETDVVSNHSSYIR